jgi:hypothetical protein
MVASPEQQRIWERIRERIAAFDKDPFMIDATALAIELIEKFPGSGLDANQAAIEFHKIRRAIRDRR